MTGEFSKGESEFIANLLREVADSIESDEPFGNFDVDRDVGLQFVGRSPAGWLVGDTSYAGQIHTPDFDVTIDITNKR
jgi:hypothetical protein